MKWVIAYAPDWLQSEIAPLIAANRERDRRSIERFKRAAEAHQARAVTELISAMGVAP